MAVEEWYKEASALLERAKKLTREELIVFKYFIDNISIGTLRTELDLKRKGISDPRKVVDKLIQLGLVEKGEYSYSLSQPLRKLRARKGGIPLPR
jgi:predicted transcriptional regulator